MKTFEQRLKAITTIDQLDDQLRKAKAYATRLRRQLKGMTNAKLAEKVEHQMLVNQAEVVLFKLRRSYFDIEDRLKAGQPA